ncbi:hypothetical protein IQ06DRAFT_12900 [Phaeosphaeriaceae sp. SRC1lsM3a]|nr:hypothetical protein IQ06DRAFT_12900 [Stagonospora sp. SRC1lsM3a]
MSIIYSSRMARFKQNQTASPLLRLPAELRNKIWEYTLGGHSIVPKPTFVWQYIREALAWWRIGPLKSPGRIHLSGEPRQNKLHFLSILSVCRQTYHETRLLPFSCNVWQCLYSSRGGCGSRTKSWAGDHLLDAEQRNAIACISTESFCDADLRNMESFKGLKVLIRVCEMDSLDQQVIDEFARKVGCRVVEVDL